MPPELRFTLHKHCHWGADIEGPGALLYLKKMHKTGEARAGSGWAYCWVHGSRTCVRWTAVLRPSST